MSLPKRIYAIYEALKQTSPKAADFYLSGAALRELINAQRAIFIPSLKPATVSTEAPKVEGLKIPISDLTQAAKV